MNNYLIQCDGSSFGNPGPSGAGILILDNNQPLVELSLFIGTRTNNQAEYFAVYYGVRYIVDRFIADEVVIETDSQLVINQLKGIWPTHDNRLRSIQRRILSVIVRFEKWKIQYHHWEDWDKPHMLAQRASRMRRDVEIKLEN